jgi:hypothetical protein
MKINPQDETRINGSIYYMPCRYTLLSLLKMCKCIGWFRRINPFQCGSLGNAYRTAWGQKSPDQIGLFGPVPPRENTCPYDCGPIGEAPFAPLLIWSCKLLRKLFTHTLPPSDIICCYTEPQQKSGAVLTFTQRFGPEDFIEPKSS